MAPWLSLSLFFALGADPRPQPPAPFAAERFREHVAYLASDELAGRDVGSEGSAKAVEYLIRHLQSSGAAPLGRRGDYRQEFPFVHRERKPVSACNVLAVVPGSGALEHEAILVSSHHDHLGIDAARIKAGKDGIFNGADDNASGCAALLLVAEALHADRDRLPPSRRTVILASFDAEERGLVGSRYYVEHPLWPLERTAADLNFDSVGRLGGGRLLALDSQSNRFLTERIETLAPACGLRVETRLNGTRRADNQSFLDREVPAVHLCSGINADYHQVTDEVARIDAAGGARIAWLGYRVLRDAMSTPGRLQYAPPPPTFNVDAILRLMFRIGIVPEQMAQSGKYGHIRFVLPGSWAAKQGLRSGDAVAGLNGKEFDDLIDAALAFARLRLDRDLRLTVLRGDKKEEVTIPAAALADFAGPPVKPIGDGRFEVLFRFKPVQPSKSVAAVGTFNKWEIEAQPMSGPDKDGSYTARVVLKPGIYEYKFVVDGRAWLADPGNVYVTGRQGNSVLTVGEP